MIKRQMLSKRAKDLGVWIDVGKRLMMITRADMRGEGHGI
jgi:hypothetical protein